MSEQIQFEIGDRVWSFSTRKWGKINDTDSYHSEKAMEFEVEFEDGSTSWHSDDDLFFEEIVIPPSARTRPTPKHEFKPGDPVFVRNATDRNTWYVSTFVSQRGGRFVCRTTNYPSGTSTWRECRPYDRTLLGFDAVEEKYDKQSTDQND